MPVLHTGCYHCRASNDFGVWYEPRGRPVGGLRLQQGPSTGAAKGEDRMYLTGELRRSTGSGAQSRIGGLDGTTGSGPGHARAWGTDGPLASPQGGDKRVAGVVYK